MKTMSIADVKANFSGLARQVEHGATVVVTRRGKPILEIRPSPRMSGDEAVAAIRAFRASRGFDTSAPGLLADETARQYAHRGHKR
ncbi:MAG: type II toxin-antitoxin system prevent-host-death family antitoxin [Candidatus Eremiobacteraeota bacterium]|nr:type II toxin-antitoxin system prevent-host-death family antitoxin [Candidatus Eremiobacteraeota bacterium]